MIAPLARPLPSPDAGFLALLPAIRRYVGHRFRHLALAAREEAVAEAVAAAFLAYRRLAQLGRQDLIYATPLAKFAVCHVRNGRHVGGHESSRDVLSHATQARRGFRVESIDQFDHQDGKWVEAIVVEDRRATPADVASTRIDFRSWLRTLDRRRREIARVLASGETTKTAARQFAITEGRISQIRRELGESWASHQGEKAAWAVAWFYPSSKSA